ncbi:hypothetical protein DNTS_021625 [Danionella cerebrum]|nr:hypothetical protein DNTS_021625 [Danionella translucida]
MSEFTLDIQLTELGFSSWNLPFCEPQCTKAANLEIQTLPEKPAPESFSPGDGPEDESVLTEKSFVLDHQYCSPIKTNPSSDTETLQVPKSPVTTTNETICDSANEEQKDETKQLHREEDKEKQVESSEISSEEPSQVADDADDNAALTDDESVKEKEDAYIEYILSDDESIDEEKDGVGEEEEEEEDFLDDMVVEEEDASTSETKESGGNEKNCCNMCDLTFSSVFLLKEHLNMHMGVRPYRCGECGKQFCQLVNYRSHLRSHSKKAAAIHCRVCSRVFDTKEQLQEHLEHNHLEKEFYQCDFCKQIFSCKVKCHNHIEEHKQQAKRHLCQKCGASFNSRDSLLNHLQWHSKGVFTCPDCERTFSTKGALLRHSFFHLGVLPYTCMKCKRHFRLASLYYNHECNPCSIQCMACFVFFQSQEDFDKHKKDTGCWAHQGSLPSTKDEIRCMECGKVFASSDELKKHGVTHLRPLRCAECGMRFHSSLMLMSHMGGHAGKRPCFCHDCGLGFPHQQGYDGHLKTCGMELPPAPVVKKQKAKTPPQTTTLNDPPADNKWKLTLNKEPPSGVPLVMYLPMSSTTVSPTKTPQSFPPSSLILETPESTPQMVPLSVVPSKTLIGKEAFADPGTGSVPKALIPLERDGNAVTKRWTIVKDHGLVKDPAHVCKLALDVVNMNQALIITRQVNRSSSEPRGSTDKPQSVTYPVTQSLCLVLEKKDIEDGKEATSQPLDFSPGMTGDGVGVVLKRISEEQSKSNCNPPAASSEHVHPKRARTDEQGSEENQSSQASVASDDAGDAPPGRNDSGLTVEAGSSDVAVSSRMEAEAGDEDSGVDMLESELQECMTCGQVLPEKDMVQHYLDHAALTGSLEPPPGDGTASATEQPSPHITMKKRLRSGKEL